MQQFKRSGIVGFKTINPINVNKFVRIFRSLVDKFCILVGLNKPLTMLELCKEILTKVSFDKVLFQKELMKALNWLKSDEIDGFRDWCMKTFESKHPEILRTTFSRD